MLRFRLGPIPVDIHGSHLFLAGLLSFLFAADGRGHAWAEQWVASHGAGNPLGSAVLAGIWILIISFSVLFHELGHALVSLFFGLQPSIALVGLGGFTRPNNKAPLPWHKDVALTAAGPAFSFALAFFAFVALMVFRAVTHGGGPIDYVLFGLASANAFWAVLNSLPVATLDGGRIASSVLMRLFGRPGWAMARVLSLVLCALVVAFSLPRGAFMLVAMFGLYAVSSISELSLYRKGLAPAPEPGAAEDPALAEAEACYRRGEYGAARVKAAAALAAAGANARLKARAHTLLGWLALKEGSGRDAVEHFSAVPPGQVAPHAMAAAQSLMGDDDKALPLWVQAARSSDDPQIRAELAGTLYRLGRDSDAREIDGVKNSAAFRCAARVHFLRGEFARAAAFAEQAFQAEPQAALAYEAARAYSQANDADAALRMLQLATQNGFSEIALLEADPDFAALRSHPEYARFAARLSKSAPA